MRIIGGQIGGIRLHPPGNLPVRPTTDIAKEALFNILENRIDLGESDCLDLFSGTGNIAFELASRGARTVDAVDAHFRCVKYISETAQKHNLDRIHPQKADVFRYLSQTTKTFDLIFADPPYDMRNLPELAHEISNGELLRPNGILVIEHPSTRKMTSHPWFQDVRKYGYSSFAFYQRP